MQQKKCHFDDSIVEFSFYRQPEKHICNVERGNFLKFVNLENEKKKLKSSKQTEYNKKSNIFFSVMPAKLCWELMYRLVQGPQSMQSVHFRRK